MRDMPLVSFCVPTYNRSHLLAQLLDQLVVIKQAFPDGTIEILVGDNCFTDDTVSLVRQRYQQHGVKLQIRESNIGLNMNWLTTVSASTGIYVWPYADDDLFDVPLVIDVINNHLVHETADFYCFNFVAGYYAEGPCTNVFMTDMSQSVDCDIIFPDMASLIPYVGIMHRGIVMLRSILRGDIIRQAHRDDFLLFEGHFDQAEMQMRFFKFKRTELLRACLMLHCQPRQGPRWAEDGAGGTAIHYITSVEVKRRIARMIDNGTIHPSLIGSNGHVTVQDTADGQYMTLRQSAQSCIYADIMANFAKDSRPLPPRHTATIGACASYLRDDNRKALFQAVHRLAEAPQQPLYDQLQSLRSQVRMVGMQTVWQAAQWPPYEHYVGKMLNISGLGIHDAAKS